ncbi:MAG: hypothetical protein HGB17_03270, partial [Syntrophobacteraceae bacterium]|nr:hypothetical protein [Syntrophobacteraceae bacterium]
ILASHTIEDPKSLFQEWAQSQGYQAPRYVTRSTTGPDHSKVLEVDVLVHDEVYGAGLEFIAMTQRDRSLLQSAMQDLAR